MKMARVILFTGQMDAMSVFYGQVLGLKQISSEKGWREFAEERGSACTPVHPRRAAKGPRLRSMPMTLPPCARSWWRGVRRLARFGSGMNFFFAMARTRTGILFSCRTVEVRYCIQGLTEAAYSSVCWMMTEVRSVSLAGRRAESDIKSGSAPTRIFTPRIGSELGNKNESVPRPFDCAGVSNSTLSSPL